MQMLIRPYSYGRGGVIDLVVKFFGLDPRTYIRVLGDLNERMPQWNTIRTLLKGVRIEQRPSEKPKIRSINGIIPRAGFVEFTLANGERTTVQARWLFLSRDRV